MDRLENLTLEGELTPEQSSAIAITKKIANSLIGGTREKTIVQDYRDGKTQFEIAREHLPETYESNKEVARGSIYQVIKDTILLTDEEREEFANQHKISGGKKTQKLRLGVHGRSKSEMAEDGRKGAAERGSSPWYTIPYRENFVDGTEVFTPEVAYAYNLSLDREYKRSSSSNGQKIAEKLNEMYHDGVEVRSSNSVSQALFVFRKTFLKK